MASIVLGRHGDARRSSGRSRNRIRLVASVNRIQATRQSPRLRRRSPFHLHSPQILSDPLRSEREARPKTKVRHHDNKTHEKANGWLVKSPVLNRNSNCFGGLNY